MTPAGNVKYVTGQKRTIIFEDIYTEPDVKVGLLLYNGREISKSKFVRTKMISQRIQNYINDHAFCSEYLFKDWESFLDLLYAEGGRISSILWWDHCRKTQQHESVGSGGYRDPENDEYIYAETQLYKSGLETNTLEEIKEYINQERKTGLRYDSKYKSHDPVPSFYLAD